MGGEIHIKFRPKYIGFTKVRLPRVTDWWCRYVAYQGAHSRRPLIVGSIDSSKSWQITNRLPFEITHSPKMCVGTHFFSRTIRYAFVPEGSLFGFVSILVAEVGTCPPQSIPPT